IRERSISPPRGGLRLLRSAAAHPAGWCGSAALRTSAAHECAGGSRARLRWSTSWTRKRRGCPSGMPSCSVHVGLRRDGGASRMKRVLSVWLPHLAIERWAKSGGYPPDAPVVLTVEGTHGLIIQAVTKAAAACGARLGARLTDARALEPSLVAVPADPEGDAALVQRLAAWAGRWSPLVEVDGDVLRLDVSGVAHLFGGEAGLVRDVQRRFAALGLTARVAIAPTAAAAWALSRFGGAELAPLPVTALRLDADTVRTLERLGLKTIGALLDMPRLALARR